MTEKYYVVSETGEYIEYKDETDEYIDCDDGQEEKYYNALLKSFISGCERAPEIVLTETALGDYIDNHNGHTELELRKCEKCGTVFKLPTFSNSELCPECEREEMYDIGVNGDTESRFISMGKAVLLFYKKHERFPDPVRDADELLDLEKCAEEEDFDELMSDVVETIDGEEIESVDEFVGWWA